jgi:hypothetical protein
LGLIIQHETFCCRYPYDFDDTDLKEMFELYGEVVSKVATTKHAKAGALVLK